MKLFHPKFLGLLTITVLIVFFVGCGLFQHGPTTEQVLKNSAYRVVTISGRNPGYSNPCEVDFPVALLRISQKHTIAWVASDHDYWIVFVDGNPIGANKIRVTKGHMAGPFPVVDSSSSINYFMYAIYDVDPETNPHTEPCKSATDDRDTGLNVKR